MQRQGAASATSGAGSPRAAIGGLPGRGAAPERPFPHRGHSQRVCLPQMSSTRRPAAGLGRHAVRPHGQENVARRARPAHPIRPRKPLLRLRQSTASEADTGTPPFSKPQRTGVAVEAPIAALHGHGRAVLGAGPLVLVALVRHGGGGVVSGWGGGAWRGGGEGVWGGRVLWQGDGGGWGDHRASGRAVPSSFQPGPPTRFLPANERMGKHGALRCRPQRPPTTPLPLPFPPPARRPTHPTRPRPLPRPFHNLPASQFPLPAPRSLPRPSPHPPNLPLDALPAPPRAASCWANECGRGVATRAPACWLRCWAQPGAAHPPPGAAVFGGRDGVPPCLAPRRAAHPPTPPPLPRHHPKHPPPAPPSLPCLPR